MRGSHILHVHLMGEKVTNDNYCFLCELCVLCGQMHLLGSALFTTLNFSRDDPLLNRPPVLGW